MNSFKAREISESSRETIFIPIFFNMAHALDLKYHPNMWGAMSELDKIMLFIFALILMVGTPCLCACLYTVNKLTDVLKFNPASCVRKNSSAVADGVVRRDEGVVRSRLVGGLGADAAGERSVGLG